MLCLPCKKIQDPAIKSPLRANWDGVVVEAPDAQTVRFTLKSAYAPFIKNLTLGILPKHLWSTVTTEEFPFSELNAQPVGSGPYRVAAVSRTASGIPSSYGLAPFSGYALGEPYLSLTLKFYQNEDALVSALSGGAIDAASGISPDKLSDLKGANVVTAPLNRVFGVFFNQNQSDVLRERAVRQALDLALDREDLITHVLSGYGTPLTGPVPPSVQATAQTDTSTQGGLAAAQQLLAQDGWKPGPDGILQKNNRHGQKRYHANARF